MKSAVFTGGRPVPCLEYNPVSLSVGEKLVPTQLQVLLIDSNELYLMDSYGILGAQGAIDVMDALL